MTSLKPIQQFETTSENELTINVMPSKTHMNLLSPWHHDGRIVQYILVGKVP
jgi:hypothetical protein